MDQRLRIYKQSIRETELDNDRIGRVDDETCEGRTFHEGNRNTQKSVNHDSD